MVSAIPFISISFARRAALSWSLLLLLADCRPVVPSGVSVAPVAETARSAYDFVNSIGLNTHLNYFDRIYGNFPLVQRELRSLGVLHLRDGVHLQNSDYNATLYGRWIQLGKMSVRFDAVLDPRSNLGPLNPALLDQVNELSGETIESIEGPNEFDVSHQSDWTAIDQSYQAQIFSAVHSMSSSHSIAVIGPSLAFASNGSRLGDLSTHLDEGNLHPYPAGKMPSIVIPGQIALERIVCDNKPIVFTESGYHNAINVRNDQPGISEAAAARYIPRLFLENFLHGIPRTYLYEFMDEAPEPRLTDPQMHWGLVRADGSEKPAFSALENLIQLVSDPAEPRTLQPLRWTLDSTSEQIHHILLQKSNGAFLLILWQEVPSYDIQRHADINNPDVAATLTLPHTARVIKVYEPAVQARPLHTWSAVGSVPIAIPDHPLVVEISF
jgi:hypothetical protein